MSTAGDLASKFEKLSAEDQQILLSLIERLLRKKGRTTPLRDVAGVLKGPDLEESDFREAREAVWRRQREDL